MSVEKRTHKSGRRTITSWRVKWRLHGTGPWQSRTLRLESDALLLNRVLKDHGWAFRSEDREVATLSLIGATVPDFGDLGSGVSMREAAEEWATDPTRDLSDRTVNLYMGVVRALGDLGRLPVDKVTARDVSVFLRDRAKSGLSTSTLARHRQVIIGALSAHDRDGVVAKVDRITPRREKDPTYLSESQVETLLVAVREVAPADYALAVEVTVRMGLRWGEVFALTPRSLSADGRSIRVRQAVKQGHTAAGGFTPERTKNGQARTVPVPAGLRPRLLDMAEGVHLDSPLFKPALAPFWTKDRTDTQWDKTRAKAVELDEAFPRMRFHDLRHTAAKSMLTRGVRLEVVSRILGHASVAFTAATYWDYTEDDMDHALDLMAG